MKQTKEIVARHFLALAAVAQKRVVRHALALHKLDGAKGEDRSVREILRDVRRECRDNSDAPVDCRWLKPAMEAELERQRDALVLEEGQ